jgi:inorganic pyrophosphatase
MNGYFRSLLDLPAFDPETKLLNAIIETPKGSRNKISYDEKLCVFRLKKTLALGAVFPFDFGFIPQTWAEDDGPLDVLVIAEEPTFPGCLIPARVLGAIEASQTKNGRIVRNDRFIAAADSMLSPRYKSLRDLKPKLIDEIEHFFVSYNLAEGKTFKPLRRSSPTDAKKLIVTGRRIYRDSKMRETWDGPL